MLMFLQIYSKFKHDVGNFSLQRFIQAQILDFILSSGSVGKFLRFSSQSAIGFALLVVVNQQIACSSSDHQAEKEPLKSAGFCHLLKINQNTFVHEMIYI